MQRQQTNKNSKEYTFTLHKHYTIKQTGNILLHSKGPILTI